jgi:hypothetical protein
VESCSTSRLRLELVEEAGAPASGGSRAELANEMERSCQCPTAAASAGQSDERRGTRDSSEGRRRTVLGVPAGQRLGDGESHGIDSRAGRRIRD